MLLIWNTEAGHCLNSLCNHNRLFFGKVYQFWFAVFNKIGERLLQINAHTVSPASPPAIQSGAVTISKIFVTFDLGLLFVNYLRILFSTLY